MSKRHIPIPRLHPGSGANHHTQGLQGKSYVPRCVPASQTKLSVHKHNVRLTLQPAAQQHPRPGNNGTMVLDCQTPRTRNHTKRTSHGTNLVKLGQRRPVVHRGSASYEVRGTVGAQAHGL